jgi:hypothetical protein
MGTNFNDSINTGDGRRRHNSGMGNDTLSARNGR